MNALITKPRNRTILRELSPLSDLLDETVYPLFGGWGSNNKPGWSPIDETENGYYCEFDMPGLEKEDIQINVIDKCLYIKGEKEEGNKKRSYSETIRLGDSIVEEDINAEYKNGVLSLHIPKIIETKDEVRKIEVK